MTTYDGVLFGIHFHVKPIAFSLPFGSGWNIYWYGIIIATGFLLALLYAMKNNRRFGIDPDRMLDVVLVATPVAILCARAYYIIFDDASHFSDFFDFSSSSGFSGLAIYGGLIGALVAAAVMCYVRKVNILDLFDLASAGFLIGQGIGRWGNFVNQEAYGSFTGSSWWGMQSTRTISEMGEGLVHPCFLYESIWCIAGFFVLNALGKKRTFKGEIILCYGVWYGFERGFVELLRTDSLMWGSVRVSSMLSFLLVIACAVTLVCLKKHYGLSDVQQDYTPVFDSGETSTTEADCSSIEENADISDLPEQDQEAEQPISMNPPEQSEQAAEPSSANDSKDE